MISINPLKKTYLYKIEYQKFYPNASLCDEGCETKVIDIGIMTALVIVNLSMKQIKDNILLKNLVGEIIDLIDDSNIFVLKCYKYILKYLKRSLGGYITLCLILIHIILTLKFLFMKIQKFKNMFMI